MAIKILILGSNGIIGSDILKSISGIYDVRSYGHKDLDITNFDLIDNRVQEFDPDIIINSAAYTQVEEAENNKSLCYDVNSYAIKNLSELCNFYKIQLIHLSTDYIFDGKQNHPYTESDSGTPIIISEPDSNYAKIYKNIAEKILTLIRE